MTAKPSPILLTKQYSLEGMPEPQKHVVRQAMLGAVRGMNEQHDGRWRRFVNRLLTADMGEVFQILHITDRAGPYHRMHLAFEQRLFDLQEKFTNIKAFRAWLKIGALWCDWAPGPRGGVVPIPRSESFEDMSDDEMREVHQDMVRFMEQPHAQRHLWPHLSAKGRAEMLETALKGKKQEGGHG